MTKWKFSYDADDPNYQEITIAGETLLICFSTKIGAVYNNNLHFQLVGNNIDELKADALRQARALFLHKAEAFKQAIDNLADNLDVSDCP